MLDWLEDEEDHKNKTFSGFRNSLWNLKLIFCLFMIMFQSHSILLYSRRTFPISSRCYQSDSLLSILLDRDYFVYVKLNIFINILQLNKQKGFTTCNLISFQNVLQALWYNYMQNTYRYPNWQKFGLIVNVDSACSIVFNNLNSLWNPHLGWLLFEKDTDGASYVE